MSQNSTDAALDERLARDWGLRAEEWVRYRQVMQGARQSGASQASGRPGREGLARREADAGHVPLAETAS